jgi:hypothetical protein
LIIGRNPSPDFEYLGHRSCSAVSQQGTVAEMPTDRERVPFTGPCRLLLVWYLNFHHPGMAIGIARRAMEMFARELAPAIKAW